MTPKEKAEELISKYIIVQDEWYLDKLVDGLRIAQAKLLLECHCTSIQ